ncbi:hypothetical protein F0919_04975 [Taibaiella lutea]|uniref:Uncharacterized protein n=1 Tax=Taibaiella lutea TaxID=2608001 RepID=A0A5M6CP64_9BACT|nr:hypothetical protein [Taibaiella lutea]KAA5537028.1 hypothetical protein F0919_04975 [Taibaiella lutea]
MTVSAYQAKSTNSLSFDLTKDGKLIGKLSYKSWFKFNAVIEITNNPNYKFEPKGFWGTTIELKEGEKVLLKFKMNWNGEIIIQTYFNNLEKDYIFKHRGIFKESFILIDQEGNELLVMKPNLKWNNMNYEYQLTSSDIFENFSNKEILLMSSLHCANYYISLMMSYQ